MNVGEVLLARGFYYDRNPLEKSLSYIATGVAPHPVTTRATYTVPAGKKAFITSAYAAVFVDAAKTTLAQNYANVEATQNVGGVVLARAFARGTAIGSGETSAVGVQTLLSAGDAIQLTTIDQSTGGTAAYVASCTAFEFDA